MNSLAITVGLPLSGKSTTARKLKDYGYVIVCPDTIRLSLHGKQYDVDREPEVWHIAQIMVKTLLKQGHDVLVDATNTTRKRRSMWVDMAEQFDQKLLIYIMDTDVETCHKRNMELGRLDPSIINRMHEQFEQPSEDEGIIMEHI